MISFWITFSQRWALARGCACPLGLGVTADDFAQAVEMVRRAGYRLPDDGEDLVVHEEITLSELEHMAPAFVLAHMGPMPVRGIWYPFHGIR